MCAFSGSITPRRAVYSALSGEYWVLFRIHRHSFWYTRANHSLLLVLSPAYLFCCLPPPPPLPRQPPSLPQMDSNLNITVSLTDYNCFNSEGPNMCDGGIKEASPHKRANTIYFVVTCVVLGSLALILVGVIIVTTLKPKNNGNDDDDEGAPLTQGDSYAPHGGRSVN